MNDLEHIIETYDLAPDDEEMLKGLIPKEQHEQIVTRIMGERQEAENKAREADAKRRRAQGDITVAHMRGTAFQKRFEATKGLLRAIFENGGKLPDERRQELNDVADEMGWK